MPERFLDMQKDMLKKLRITGTLKYLLAAVLAACSAGVYAVEITLDSTAAVVNNDIILTSELDSMQARIQHRMGDKVDALSSRRAAMEYLISRSLLSQLVRDQGVEVTDMQIDEALNKAAMRNHTSTQDILNSFGSELGIAAQREAFKNELLASEIKRSRIRARINVSDSEVEALAQNLKKQGSIEPSYHISQIIIPLSANPTEQEYRRASADSAAVASQLRKGEDFNALAARYTTGALASQGGDLGYLPESQVPLPFVPGLVKSKPGDWFGPIRSPVGFHYIKVFDISHSSIAPIKTYAASHILLKTSIVFSDEAARARLQELRASILAGTISFSEAAKRYSEDTGSAARGGSLGYSVPERYDPAFATALVQLKKGQISEPFRSSFGWHIILLEDTKVDTESMDAYRDRARSIIYEREYNEQSGVWEKELRDSAYIHITDPALLRLDVPLDQEAH